MGFGAKVALGTAGNIPGNHHLANGALGGVVGQWNMVMHQGGDQVLVLVGYTDLDFPGVRSRIVSINNSLDLKFEIGIHLLSFSQRIVFQAI